MSAVTRLKGVVKFFRSDKAYGFITLAGGDRDVFFHLTNWAEDDFPQQGDHVTFIEDRGRNGKTMATQVIREPS
jgi:cold shock CspA family protein